MCVITGGEPYKFSKHGHRIITVKALPCPSRFKTEYLNTAAMTHLDRMLRLKISPLYPTNVAKSASLSIPSPTNYKLPYILH